MRRKIIIVAACLMTAVAANATTIEMKVYGMVCGFCAQGIEKTLRKNPATHEVLVDLENKLVVVTTRDDQNIPDAELTRAIADAGYEVKGITRTERTLDDIRGGLQRGTK